VSAKPTINACTQYRCRDLPSRLKLTVRFWLTRTFCLRVALALDLYYQKAHEMGSAECVLGIERCPFPTAGCIRKPFIQAGLIWLLLADFTPYIRSVVAQMWPRCGPEDRMIICHVLSRVGLRTAA